MNKKDNKKQQAQSKNEMEDAYALLELDRNATEEQIKKAYRKMALRWHPVSQIVRRQG